MGGLREKAMQALGTDLAEGDGLGSRGGLTLSPSLAIGGDETSRPDGADYGSGDLFRRLGGSPCLRLAKRSHPFAR